MDRLMFPTNLLFSHQSSKIQDLRRKSQSKLNESTGFHNQQTLKHSSFAVCCCIVRFPPWTYNKSFSLNTLTPPSVLLKVSLMKYSFKSNSSTSSFRPQTCGHRSDQVHCFLLQQIDKHCHGKRPVNAGLHGDVAVIVVWSVVFLIIQTKLP